MNSWKTLDRQTILNHNRFLRVENHAVQLPDGQVIDDWPWIVTPDYVIALAETENGRILCFRQYKYGVGGTSLAPVGGYLEQGEEPLAAAKRELLEETGYEAVEWIDLGGYVVDGNRGAGTAYLFLARQARPVAEPDADDLEEQKLLLLSRDELEMALANGEFKALPWVTAVALALRQLD
ncbi:MAG: NUDIX hydrolase [Chloroflexi bacterium]|nr:NUDIX hydrolase [Chloroflexota bacterium]